MVRVLAFAGSLRAGSFNKQLVAVAARGTTAAGAAVTHLAFNDYPLPLYDQDVERAGFPEQAKRLKELFLAHDGLLIASPEYNSGFSGVLKNALDWVSRPLPGEKPLACFQGTSEASNFRDAVRQHQLIDQIVQTSETFFK